MIYLKLMNNTFIIHVPQYVVFFKQIKCTHFLDSNYLFIFDNQEFSKKNEKKCKTIYMYTQVFKK